MYQVRVVVATWECFANPKLIFLTMRSKGILQKKKGEALHDWEEMFLT